MTPKVSGTPDQIEVAAAVAVVAIGSVAGFVLTPTVASVLRSVFTEESIRRWAESAGYDAHCVGCTVHSWATHIGLGSKPQDKEIARVRDLRNN